MVLIAAVSGCDQALADSQSNDCAVAPQRCALEALRTTLARNHERVDLQVKEPLPVAVSLRIGEVVRVRPIRWTGLPVRRMTVWLDVRSDGKVLRSVPVEIEVHAYAPVWQATIDLRPAATEVDKDSLTKTMVDMTAMSNTPWRDEVEGCRLRKPLLAGQVLTVAHVERVTAVTRGQMVEVQAASGELRIDAQAQALQDGQVGEFIQVRVPRSAAAVAGRVVGPGTVEVVW